MTVAEIAFLLAGVIAGVAITIITGMFFVGRRPDDDEVYPVGGTD